MIQDVWVPGNGCRKPTTGIDNAAQEWATVGHTGRKPMREQETRLNPVRTGPLPSCQEYWYEATGSAPQAT